MNAKGLATIIVLVTCSLPVRICHAQKLQTLFHPDSAKMKSLTLYGEMFVKGSQLNGSPALVVGGRTGFMVNKKFAFGGVAQGFLSKSKFLGLDRSGNPASLMHLNMNMAGVYVEPVLKMNKAIHVSFPINFLLGSVEVNKFETGERIEGSRLRCIEPGVNLEFNCTQYLIIALTGSYRIAKINSLLNIANQDVSGFVVGVAGKIGKF